MHRLLKPQSWLLKFAAITLLISCHRTETHYGLQQQENQQLSTLDPKALKIDLSKVPTLAVNYEEIAKKYQAISGSEVRSLIDSIPHKEVVVGILDPKTKRPMPIPAFFAAKGEQELMFVPAILLEEAALILQDYYTARSDSNKVQIISVADLEDWIVLLQKAGPGIAGSKNFDWSNVKYLAEFEKLKGNETREEKPNTDGGINRFFRYSDRPSPWVRLCRQAWMHDAVDRIPRQSDTQPHNGWSCGPNSAAKAIHMFGHNMSEAYYRNTFLPDAPRFFNRQTVSNIGEGMAVGGGSVAIVGIILAPFTGGATIPLALVGYGATMGGVGLVAVGEFAPSDTGVKPENLAKHITNYLPGTKKALYKSYDDFWECAKIIRDDLRRGDPVIVFWSFSAIQAHYVNVVGVSVDNSDLPEEFVIMDTNNRLYKLNWQDMRTLMKREFAFYALTATTCDDYHMVRFYR